MECVHYGHLATVDESGLKHSLGDDKFLTFYRSSSKPIQCLPLYAMELDKKYGLTDEELSIMNGSLWCSPHQVELMKSIMEKGGIAYDTLIMKPCYPIGPDYALNLKVDRQPPSKLYHNCMGKHLALILVQRELGGPEKDYYLIESKVQQLVLQYLEAFTDVPAADIGVGVDGCGVPVFAVPLDSMALSFLRLAAPDLIADKELAAITRRNVDIIAKYPENLMDAKALCGVLCEDPNIVGKLGAQGVYTLGLKKERLGFACKMLEGVSAYFPLTIAAFLEQIDYENKATIQRLYEKFPTHVKNDNDWLVGEKKPGFTL